MTARTPTLRVLLDRLWLYLPLGFVALLALGSYWLVRTAPAVTEAATPGAAPSGVDYRLHGFVLRSFDTQGALRSEVMGKRAVHETGGERLLLTEPRLRSHGRDARSYQATAQSGTMDDAQTRLELQGRVRANRTMPAEPTAHYESEYLQVLVDVNRLQSHLPVRFIRGKDQFQAQSMEYDEKQGMLLLQGRVRGVLTPGKAGDAPLPSEKATKP